MKIITTLLPVVLMACIMYFTDIFMSEESMALLSTLFVGSILWPLIILWVNKISKRN